MGSECCTKRNRGSSLDHKETKEVMPNELQHCFMGVIKNEKRRQHVARIHYRKPKVFLLNITIDNETR